MNGPFELPSEVNIYSAAEIRDKLLQWATEQSAASVDLLVVSAKNVVELDGSGLQLLAALANGEMGWKLIDPSQAFSEACEMLGCSHWLGSVSKP
jgi:anti-anti-sigma regulatory factor